MIISRTPFRISFFGGGTDFPSFYEQHGGATILTTIDKYCYISIHEIEQYFSYVFRASYANTELVQHPSEFKHPLIRECLLQLKISHGLEITHVSDLPGRTGLGTSSAFTVGLLNALHTLRCDRVTPEDLAQEAILIERERVGDAGGHQDQYSAAYGGFIRLDFSDGKRIGVKRIPIHGRRLEELENSLLLVYTGLEQSAEEVLREQQNRLKQNEKNLLTMYRMVNEAEQILMDGDLRAFGDLLHESWMLKRTLSKGISNSSIDDVYEIARKAGARGGKLLGAGGRGCLLLYADPDRNDSIRKALSKLRHVPIQFGQEGSRIIFNSSGRDSSGRTN